MTAKSSDDASKELTGDAAPRVWVLLGHRHGDNQQLEALSDALGWPSEKKELVWSRPLPKWHSFYGRRVNLDNLSETSRRRLEPPWPDLVLSIGWRSVPVARWIQRQCGAKLVHLGRPRAPVSYFDLILTTPQYRLPASENVVLLAGPLIRYAQSDLSREALRWQDRLSGLPRPRIAVFVGGNTPSLLFRPEAAKRLGSQCNHLASSEDGSLIIVSGPRTPSEVISALTAEISVPSYVYEWGQEEDNPYQACLSLADQFIVTDDSISMANDAALTGRPLHIFQLEHREKWSRRVFRKVDDAMWQKHIPASNFYSALVKSGVITPPKSNADHFQKLLAEGRSVLLGQPGASGIGSRDESENARAAQAVRALF